VRTTVSEEVLEQLRGHVARAVNRLCPARLSAEREDIIQVALMRILKVVPAGERSTTPATSYIWKTAFSVTIDEIRRRDRRPEAPLDDSAVATITVNAPSPEDRLVGRELGAAIRDCLQTLPTNRRRGVVLFLLGHAPREVAARLGWSAKKADNLVYRGMNMLRACLSAKGLRP
jgi:RNA polymerase sigma-70 factor (ECF subfamily)